MKHILCFGLLAALGASCGAHALGSLADIAIIDRDSGAVLSPHFYRGEYWVAGTPGARYAIEIRNRFGERLLAVTSVDGVNVISGETAGWGQSGYVFGAGESYRITGWRKSDAEVAAFTFTASPNSYAERTGRPANVGVIGVAVFRERPQPEVYAPPPVGRTSPIRPDMPAARESSAAPLAESAGRAPAQDSNVAPPVVRSAPPAPKLGTGHGGREYSYVSHTDFSRMQPQPNEVIRIHYDSLDNLFAMGIIKPPRPWPPAPDPFPASPTQRYVPDPPG